MSDAQYIITAPNAEYYRKLQTAIQRDIKALSMRGHAAPGIEFDADQRSIRIHHEFDVFHTIVGTRGKTVEVMPIDVNIFGLFNREGGDTANIGPYKIRRMAGNPWHESAKCISDAESGYSSLPPKSYLTCAEEAKPQSILCDMLAIAPGVCLGESHSDPVCRQLLTNQMAELKKLGVGAIFLEGLRAEFNQDLDKYMADANAPIPPVVKDWLDQAEQNLKLRTPDYKPQYAMHRLLEEAKKHGIKVYGLSAEITARYPPQNGTREQRAEALYHRGVTFNDFAVKTVRQYSKPGEKIIALTGAGHATYSPYSFYKNYVAGIDKQLGFPSLLISSANEEIEPCVLQPHRLREQQQFIPYKSESNAAKFGNSVTRESEADYIAYISPRAVSVQHDMRMAR